MSRSSKRRPDARAIRPTATYSVEELAAALDKSPATIQQWMRDGLQPIDDRKPALIYGWVFKEWHEAWWEERKTQCAPDEFFCMGCRDRRHAAEGSLMAGTAAAGSPRLRANCAVCGTVMYKNMGIDAALSLLSGSAKKDGVGRFNQTRIPTDSATDRAVLTETPEKTADEADRPVPNPARGGRSKPVTILPRNAANERLKREYFEYLRNSDGMSDLSIRKREAVLLRWESFNGYGDLGSFTRERAIAFKEHLVSLGLQAPTRIAEQKGIQHFLRWMIRAKPKKASFKPLDIDYLNPTRAERSIANGPRLKACPSVEEALRAFLRMPATNPVERRNRAIFALLADTGIRIGALITLRVKHCDLAQHRIDQDSREVATKFRKRIVTYLLGVHEEFESELQRWHDYLVGELGFGPDDPLFPALQRGAVGAPVQLAKAFFGTEQAVYNMVRQSFAAAGLPAHSPHRFRDMLVGEMFKRDITIAQAKAWSQNLGHSKPLVTLNSYGQIPVEEQGRLIRNRKEPVPDDLDRLAGNINLDQLATAIAQKIREKGS